MCFVQIATRWIGTRQATVGRALVVALVLNRTVGPRHTQLGLITVHGWRLDDLYILRVTSPQAAFEGHWGAVMLPVLINVVTIVVIGVICFSLINWFVSGKPLGNLLKIIVALICLAAIVQRLLSALGVSF